MLDSDLLAYWQHGREEAQAAHIIQDALAEPPTSAKVTARVLALAARTGLPPVWAGRVQSELAPRLAELTLRLRQVDRIGDAASEPTILFQELGEEAEAINLERLDIQALRSTRLGAGSRAHAAQKYLEALGPDALPEPIARTLQTAIDDLTAQIERRELAQALLVGQHDEGFVIGLHLKLTDNAEIATEENVDESLRIAASTAIRGLLADGGARYGMEWTLPFQGSSIGLPMALATLVARGTLEPDPLTAATGHVLADGAVTGVGAIEAKLAAAAAAGIRRVVLAEENRIEAERAAPENVELRFISDVGQLERAVRSPWSSAEVGIAAKRTIVRTLSRGVGFEVTDERPVSNGYQFKLQSAKHAATITIYDSGTVTVGAGAGAKAVLDAFADEYLRDPPTETRQTLTLRVPGEDLQGRVREGLLASNADEQDARQHERWRIRLARGKSAATAVLYNSSKLVLSGTAPAHDEARTVLAPLLAPLAGSEMLTAPPAAQRVRERRAASFTEPWIGTDESGKGDYFGPLVSAAVYVDPELAARLQELGAQDSKRLTDTRINNLAPQLNRLLGKRAKVTVIQPARYNSLYREMRGEGKNLNSLLAWGHYRSVLDLLGAGARPAYLIVDQFADAAYIEQRLSGEAERRDIEILQFPKAEADVAVAAASILAREAFLAWLARESAALGLALPKGAGENVVQVARQLVAAQGKDALGRVAKLSFKTTEKVLA